VVGRCRVSDASCFISQPYIQQHNDFIAQCINLMVGFLFGFNVLLCFNSIESILDAVDSIVRRSKEGK
jgi:hypothetical protein